MKNWFILGIGILLTLWACDNKVLNTTSTQTQEFQLSNSILMEIEQRVSQQINPGISIAILHADGRRSFHNFGFLGIHNKDSITENSIFELGSLTKTFTAWLILQSAIDTSQNLSYYFDTIENVVLDSITIHQLLNHQAGVPRLSDYFDPQDWSNPFSDYSSEQLVKELKYLKTTDYAVWSYSNLGYAILGHILEKQHQKEGSSLLDSLCKAMGMFHSHSAQDQVPQALLASPSNLGVPFAHWEFSGPSRFAGGLLSSSKELLQYLNHQIQHNSLFKKDKIKSYNTGISDLGKDKIYYRDGWFRYQADDSTEILFHNGVTGGFANFMGYNTTTGEAVVVLSNGLNLVDDLGFNILYADFDLNHPTPSIAYAIAQDIEKGDTIELINQYQALQADSLSQNLIDIYWLERYHFGQGHYRISNQLADILLLELAEDWEVQYIKAQNLMKLKEFQNAIPFIEKALELNPKHPLLFEELKVCRVKRY